MEDSSSDDSNSVTDYFLNLDDSSVFDTETCDSLIDGFGQCNVAEKEILSLKGIHTQGHHQATGLAFQSIIPNNDDANKNIVEENGTVESLQETSLNNKVTQKIVTQEVGINTDKSFNCKATKFRQPYLKFRKHLNQYHDFKRTYQNHNNMSRRNYKRFNNYKNYNQTYNFPHTWHFKQPQWQDERTRKAFYFFTEFMKCFN